MTTKNVIVSIGILAILGTGIFLWLSNPAPVGQPTQDVQVPQLTNEQKQQEQAATSTPVSTKGSYETYSSEKITRAENGKVVLFFFAAWCPTCRQLDANISSSLSTIPDGTTILKTDYDSETALKKKYGVTYQHTLVQVDADGNMIAKWAGSPTLASLLQNIK
ncbi:MAG TPA: thioredoxin family protein [Candidatus Nanoarchaeia archaeon]|nr:thioredoxin family protein [Candidatus Nanoarchaeia archaeon]